MQGSQVIVESISRIAEVETMNTAMFSSMLIYCLKFTREYLNIAIVYNKHYNRCQQLIVFSSGPCSFLQQKYDDPSFKISL